MHKILIKDQIKMGKKVVIIGDKLNVKGAIQLGWINKKKCLF